MNCADEPEPSECTTGTTGLLGNAWPLLSLVMAGSFQLVIWFVKMPASVGPDSRRLRTSLPATFSWYGNAVPPATMGR